MKDDVCEKCGSPLGEMVTTKSGKTFQRCSTGNWNPETKSVDGCDFIKWMTPEPEELDEKCPKCGNPLVLATTKFGKKMKKCSTNKWDKVTKKATGCDYIEWINGVTEPLYEICPECGNKLVLYTTNSGKKMKKCSPSGWDKVERVATGCTYVQWLKASEVAAPPSTGEEFLPPEPSEFQK